MRSFEHLEKYRNVEMEKLCYGESTEKTRRVAGIFEIPVKGVRKGLKCVVSTGESPYSQGWDHVSVSLGFRTPTWDEMCIVKNLFFEPHDVCVQYHPAESDYVTNHKFCLHIWRNIHMEFPTPPKELVGIQGVENIQGRNLPLETFRRFQDQAVQTLTSK